MVRGSRLDYAVNVVAPIRVLVVSDEARGEADYLRAALAPYRAARRRGNDPASVTVIGSSELAKTPTIWSTWTIWSKAFGDAAT